VKTVRIVDRRTAESEYVFSQESANERRRLDALASIYDDDSIRRLVDIGVSRGRRCWEVGAGSGTIAQWMATRVANEGYVLVTDIDTRFVESLAGRNVEVRRHDVVNEPLDDGSFDVVHARALLEHLPERERALQNMVRALRPGGWLLVEDVVQPPSIADPSNPVTVITKTIGAIQAAFRSIGADADYGIRLPKALTASGLTEVHSEARVPLVSSGTPAAEFVALSLQHLGERFVASGLLTPAEVNEVLGVLRTPGTNFLGLIMVAAWGRRRNSTDRSNPEHRTEKQRREKGSSRARQPVRWMAKEGRP
jgi:SAM-dependent methyltransferase